MTKGPEQSSLGSTPSSPPATSHQFPGSSEKSDAQPAAEISASSNEPPDGGYGWVCVACCFLINAHTWGINSSYAVFLAWYLSNNYYPNASPLKFAFVGGLSISQSLLISPLATYTTREFGTRVTLLLGVILETIALIGASFTHQIWQLFLTQGICFGFGMGFLFVGSVGIIPQWFGKRRSLANGIGTAGSGIGALMYSLGTNAMIETLGVQWAFRILGILCFVVNSICAILMKDRNKDVGAKQLAFDYRLFLRSEYWLLLGWGFFSLLGYVVLLFSLPNFAQSIGLSAQQGSLTAALLNLGQGIGRPAVGIFSDTAGRINLAGLATFIAGFLSLLMWTFARSYAVLIAFAIMVGTVSGTFWTAIGPVAAEVVGLRELPSCLSITWLFLVLPTTFSEPIGLALRQKEGNIYLHAQIFTGLMYIAGALCMVLLRAWKIGQIEATAIERSKSGSDATAASADGEKESLETSTALGTQRASHFGRMVKWRRV